MALDLNRARIWESGKRHALLNNASRAVAWSGLVEQSLSLFLQDDLKEVFITCVDNLVPSRWWFLFGNDLLIR